jgi:hypothetical protein
MLRSAIHSGPPDSLETSVAPESISRTGHTKAVDKALENASGSPKKRAKKKHITSDKVGTFRRCGMTPEAEIELPSSL